MTDEVIALLAARIKDQQAEIARLHRKLTMIEHLARDYDNNTHADGWWTVVLMCRNGFGR